MGQTGYFHCTNVRDGVDWVLAERDFRVHTAEIDALPSYLTGTVRIRNRCCRSCTDSPRRSSAFQIHSAKGILDQLLLALGDGWVLSYSERQFCGLPHRSGNQNADILQIQCNLMISIGVDALSCARRYRWPSHCRDPCSCLRCAIHCDFRIVDLMP